VTSARKRCDFDRKKFGKNALVGTPPDGLHKGVFEKVEEELAHNVFEFADTTVREIMVPPDESLGLEII